MKRITEVYLQEDHFNPICNAMIYGAWMAVEDGIEQAICRPWEAANSAEALTIYKKGN